MKRTTYLAMGVGITAIVTLLLSPWGGSRGVVPPVLDQTSGGSNATLAGSYAALYQGSIHDGPAASPGQPGGGYQLQAAVIVVRFDGAGGILPSSGNALNVGTEQRFFDVTGGSYSLNPDCTGDLAFTASDGIPFRHRLLVAGSGEEYRFLRLQNPPVGIIQSGTARRMDLVP